MPKLSQYNGNEWVEIALNGRDGYTPIKGKDYFDGKDGLPGKPGKNGIDGRDGKDGKPGINGKDGKDGAGVDMKEIDKKIQEISTTLSPKGKIDQRWHGAGLSKVSTDTTLTGLGTPASPLSVVPGSGSLQLPTFTVAASGGDFTNIQDALDAATGGGLIYLTDNVYTITTGLLIKYNYTYIIGNGERTLIQCNGANVTTLLKPNTTSIQQCGIRSVKLLQTNNTVQGKCMDLSNTALFVGEDLHIQDFGTGIELSDTANFTFYNSFKNIKMFGCIIGVDINGSSTANDNMFYNVRIANKNGGSYGVRIVNGQANSFYNLNVEPAGNTTNVGVFLNGATCTDNVFVNIWSEGNATGVSIASGTARTTFIGGEITSNTANLTDSGTDSTFVNVKLGATLKNQLSPIVIKEDSTSSKIGIDLSDFTNFAHVSSQLARFRLLNATDTSDLLVLTHLGTTSASASALNITAGNMQMSSVTPSQIVGNVNDYDPGPGMFYKISSDATRTVTGWVGGVDGRIIWVRNVGAQTITISNESASSAAINRFTFSTGADFNLTAKGKNRFVYDGTTQRWLDL